MSSERTDMTIQLKKKSTNSLTIAVPVIIQQSPSVLSSEPQTRQRQAHISHADEPKDHPRSLIVHPHRCQKTPHAYRVPLHLLLLTLIARNSTSSTANELIWRTNYHRNKRRGDRKQEDGGLEHCKKGRGDKRRLPGTGHE